MKFIFRILAVSLMMIAFIGCTNSERGSAVCEVHKQPLRLVRGFRPGPDLQVDPDETLLDFSTQENLDKKYPHAIPWYFSKERSWESSRPMSVRMCPECEEQQSKAYERYLQRLLTWFGERSS